MTLEKVYQKDELEMSTPLIKLLKQNNPFKSERELYIKAGLSPDEIKEFQKNPDNLSIKNLNKILSLCEFDLKVIALFEEDLDDLNQPHQMTTIFRMDDHTWEEEDMDWEEEMEEDEALF